MRGSGVQPVYDVHEFERIARTKIPNLVARAGMPAFVAVCDSLEKALDLNLGDDADASCSFRAAVDEHGQDAAYYGDERSLLIDTVRDAGESLGRADPELLPQMLAELERRSTKIIFFRLALNLVRSFPERLAAVLRRFLLDSSTLDSGPVWHERRCLERDGIAHLSADDKAVFFDMIIRGPDTAAHRAAHARLTDAHPPTRKSQRTQASGSAGIWLYSPKPYPLSFSLSTRRSSPHPGPRSTRTF
jgi:hypothetical protein